MTKDEWKKVIEGQIKFDHDYIPSFQTTIQILSEMLEERDRVYTQYIEDGARPVVEFKSDRGATNLKQNPLLRQWQEINTLCLSYLRDLGLTAGGLRKLQGTLPKETYGEDSLEQFRQRIGLSEITMKQLKPEIETKPRAQQIMTMIRANKEPATTTTTKTTRKRKKTS